MPDDLRPLVIAYNDFPIAASDDAYQINQYTINRSKDDLTLGAQFAVIGSSATDLADKIDALDALRVRNGTLVIQQARELELDDLVGDGTTTVTSATGGFLAAHVGDWLVILNVGARRITAVAGSTSITIHAAVAMGTYRAVKPARLFRGTHADRTFAAGDASCNKIASPLNTELSQHFSFSVSGTLPYASTGGLLKLTVSVSWDKSRRRTFVIGGEFLTTDADDAKDLYEDNIVALVTLHIADFGGLSAYRLVQQTEGYSTEDLTTSSETARNYTFSRTYQELGLGNDSIRDESLSVAVSSTSVHGLGLTGAVRAMVSYRGTLIAGSNLRVLYESNIRPRISQAIQVHSRNGRGQQAIESESATFEDQNHTISASWTVLLLGSSSVILEYLPSTTISNDPSVLHPALWDGKPHTYAVWQNKPTRIRTNSLTVRALSPLSYDSLGLVCAGGKNPFQLDAGAGLIAEPAGSPGDGSIRVKWPENVGGGQLGGGAAGGAGKWVQRGGEGVISLASVVGKSVYGALGTTIVYSMTLSRTEVWMEDASPFKPRFEQPQILTGL